ncbi:hypothetical protein P675_1307 [Acinetobacter baumannii UH7007]|nr:hypothetical protein P675_1307 [Acinetobacter baumannii UH7007]
MWNKPLEIGLCNKAVSKASYSLLFQENYYTLFEKQLYLTL